MPEKTIFRQKAIQSYRQNMEKDILPHLISWPAVICFWFLLVILLVAAFFIWYVQVPTYISGTGILVAPGASSQSANGQMIALAFLPPDQAVNIRAGLPVDIQISSEDRHIQSTIAQVEPNVISPDEARQRYQLDHTFPLTYPSRVVIIKLSENLSATTYAGSVFTARIETGSQRLLFLLLGGQFLGSSS